MTAVPEWMRPPRPEGWHADDPDHLPEAPRHTELRTATPFAIKLNPNELAPGRRG